MVPPPINEYAPSSAVLVDGTKCAQRHVVLNGDVAGERGVVGQDAIAAHLAVVPDVHVGHQQIAGA